MPQPSAAPSAPDPRFEVDEDRLGWIVFDAPRRSVNVLDEAVMEALEGALVSAEAAVREGRIAALVVRSGKAGSFIAGADVDAIAELEDPDEAETKVRQGQAVLSRLARLPLPTLSAIDGICLGGGLELALACRHRVASDSQRTRLGLPEVMLGILPAWGGTTRLPRLIGLQEALDLLLTGRQVDARRALRVGLVDEILPADTFVAETRRFALRLAGEGGSGATGPRRAPRGRAARGRLRTRLLDRTGLGRRLVLRTARSRVRATTGGHYPAPLRILDLLEARLDGSIEESLAAEARAAAELIVSNVSKNLIHVFRMREDARKGRAAAGLPEVDAEKVASIGVLGAGVMGGGIAQLAARRGIAAYMKDLRHDAVTGGLLHARGLFDEAVRRRRMSRREADRAMERIGGGVAYAGLSGSDVVVEAVVERLDVKRQVLSEVEAHVRDDCILATNTSSLRVAEMATALRRPERFVGMHFFNPVHRMPLVEVVRGPHSSDEAVARIHALALRLGKVPVVVSDGPGFLVNRILGPYLNEGGFLLAEGLRIEEIDQVAVGFGMPMGPLRLIDEVGIDVAHHAGASLHEALGPRLEPSQVLVRIAATERLGRKKGRGFYVYEKGEEKGPAPEVYGKLDLAPGRIPPGGRPTEDDIRRRLVLAMVNEAARALEDGIVHRAADVDLAMVMGTGFPPFRGGLLRCADQLHPRAVVDALRALEARHGIRFTPAPLLERLAREDRGFYDAFPSSRT